MGLRSESSQFSKSGVNGNDLQRQLCTFYVDQQLYGVEVIQVQEIVRHLPMTRIPLASDFVRGLINLRGQVATAIGLREMFKVGGQTHDDAMNVILRQEGALIALQVDDIGDVIEVNGQDIESIPVTIPESIRNYMSGVFQLNQSLLCVIDLDKLLKYEGDLA